MKLHLRKVIKVISVSYNSKKQSKTLHCFLKQLFNYVPHVSKMLGHNKGKTLLDNELLLHSTQMIICNPGCLIKRPMMPFQRKITPMAGNNSYAIAVMHCLTMGIHSEKSTIKQMHHCMNIVECTYTKKVQPTIHLSYVI